MAKIRVKYRGASYEFETPAEAAETMTLLENKEREQRAFREINRLGFGHPLDKLVADMSPDERAPIWTPRAFETFIGKLGPAQRAVLVLLVLRREVTDKEFCTELGIPGNQALAGTLSGITKQAAILDIPAREVSGLKTTAKPARGSIPTSLLIRS